MSELTDALTELRERLAELTLPLDLAGLEDGEQTRVELLDQLTDYVLPRLERLDAPLLVVLGGSTGAGKSTITNTLVGAEVSTPGVLRPTTRAPVLVCHPDDEAWFMSGRILPDLARNTGDRAASGLQIVVNAEMTPGVAILDSPDIDSIETDNHDLATQLLGAADLWLFVTTAARYADAVPWQYLARAAERSIGLALIVNRIPAGAEDEVTGHLSSMLEDRGLPDTRLFAISEHELIGGRLATGTDDVRSWLDALVADAAHRDELVRSTLTGAIGSVTGRVERVVAAVGTHHEAADALRHQARARYEAALDEVDAEVASGHLVRGEVLDQWRDIVGTGEFMNRMQRGISRLRDRVTGVFTGRRAAEDGAGGELRSNLSLLVRDAADRAANDVVSGWEQMPGGRTALAPAPPGIHRASPDLAAMVDDALTDWQQGVLDTVREMAGSKVATARALSWGINSIGVALMVAVFSSTGGLTGGEAAVAGGTAAVSQTVLSAVFGDQAVRDLVTAVRDDLETRLAEIFTVELDRFNALLDSGPSAEDATALDAAAERVASAPGL